MRIPFNRPHFSPRILSYVEAAYRNEATAGNGALTRKCEEMLTRMIGGGPALLTSSCTHALEMSALLLDLREGDEILMPCFTFVSTANAYALRGAKPVFVDIRPDTLNIDERRIEEAVTPRTRAIVVVHYAGVGCEMDAILEIAARHRLPVIEDNAHGLFGKYRGKNLGSLGCLAAQSFHETKNLSCGEGGALVVNDQRFHERALVLREKGTNRSKFFEGKVEKYTWVDLGSSYVLSEIQAGVLLAGLEEAAESQDSRRRVWETYARELSDWSRRHDVRLPSVPAHVDQPFHIFYLLFPSEKSRNHALRELKRQEISAVFHYLPLHQSLMAGKLGADRGDFPHTEKISATILRLPLFNFMPAQELDRVIAAVQAIRP